MNAIRSTRQSRSMRRFFSADSVPGPRLLRTSNPHRPRPSLLHLPGLRALPFWTQLMDQTTTVVAYGDPAVTKAVQHLEQHVDAIRLEYQSVAHSLRSDYQTDTEHNKLVQGGGWDWHSYMRKGKLEPGFVKFFPMTTNILRDLDLFAGTPFGYAFFSTLHAGTSIAAHTATMNFRLRIHLPLDVPDSGDCGIKVGGTSRKWVNGKALVLDDAYEHEVWNESSKSRVLLLVDVWHPDVKDFERKEIEHMFKGI